MKTKPRIIVQLVHIEGPFKGQIQEFTDDEILIGRHPSCQLRFPADHAIISRKHAKIVREGNFFKFIDHSTNGTYINGKRTEESVLKDGDVLIFAQGGPKVSFLTQVTDQVVETESTPVFENDEKLNTGATAEAPKRSPEPPRPASVPSSSRGRKGQHAKAQQRPAQQRPSNEKSSQQKNAKISKPSPPKSPEFEEEKAPAAPKDIRPSRIKAPLSVVFGPTLRSYKELPIIIGTGDDCDFPMDHPQIFDHHAQIFFHEDQYWVKDLTGKNLVSIDGISVGRQASLTANCEVGLTDKGPYFKFLGQGRLIEIEKRPSTEENDEETSISQDQSSPEGAKKKSLINKIWRR